MKNNHGITLITLIVTIIIMIILASVAVYTGLDSIQKSREVAFVAEMKLAQSRVNYIYEKIAQGAGDEYVNKGVPVTTGLANYAQIQTAINAVNQICQTKGEATKDPTNYRYYTVQALIDIGVEGATQEMIIDFVSRDVISLKGVKYNDKMYYRHFDLGEGRNVEYIPPTQIPTFSTEKRIYGLNGKIIVKDIVYATNVAKGKVFYSKVDEASPTTNNWLEIAGNEIDINETANYRVKIIDGQGNNSIIETINITLVNSPKLSDGMTPVLWDNGAQQWKVASDTDGLWYDYEDQSAPTTNPETARWANVMLQDGLTTDSNGYVTSLGSMFVWIPRYMYQITNAPTSDYTKAGTINVKFLKGTSNVPTDNKNITIKQEAGAGNWIVHPAFMDGTSNGFANGGWDKELTGFWVAKFEMSMENASGVNVNTSTPAIGNVALGANVKMVSKPGVSSWRSINIANIYTNSYDYDRIKESHLMKNSEWGAVAYLTHSKYGRNGTEISINNSSGYYTGRSSGAPDSSSTTTSSAGTYTYETPQGQLASSTGNIIGIYDLSGGGYEFTAAYNTEYSDSGTGYYRGSSYVDASGNNFAYTLQQDGKKSTRYATAYSNSTSTYSVLSEADWTSSSKKVSITGDAMKEVWVSTAYKWFNDNSDFAYSNTPFFVRGGGSYGRGGAGVFCSSSNNR